jgi:hypothetical protein
VAPRCSTVTYWLIDPSSPAPKQITNNAVACARGLYNVEARPACSASAPVDLPVTLQLSDGNRREVRARADAAAPYLLWASKDAAAARSLPNGAYYVTSTINGEAVRFTQACPRRRRPACAPGKGGGKSGGGGKGMMMCRSRKGMP